MTSPGRRIGPYEIQRELGRGGMGVVHLAVDTRLDRPVAIKALPAHLAADPDRMARFEREAKALASLNHPGIGAIYGLEEAEGHRYLVLEFVEGETLAARLERGPLPIHEAIELAVQMAEALEAAHAKGVVHRDLKPGNVMITPGDRVKVLDFGLARTLLDDAPSTIMGIADDAPTLTTPGPVHSPTIPGVIMGTAGYMSPEQARGKPVDRRSDIFAYGCVLHEMLTGARPFAGETVADVVGATLHKEIDFALLPPDTPENVRRVLRRCLAKDRRERLHDIADARLELRDAAAAPAAATPARPSRMPWLVAAVALALAGAAIVAGPRLPGLAAPPPAPPLVKFAVDVAVSTTDWSGADLRMSSNRPRLEQFTISPDGRHLAWSDSGDIVWIRRMDQIQPRRLELPWPAQPIVWSADGRTLVLETGRSRGGELWRIGIDDEEPRLVAKLPQEGFLWPRLGAAQLDGETLVVGMASGGLFTIPLRGGPPTPLLLPEEGESFVTPCPLPDGDAIVFIELTSGRVEALRDGRRTVIMDFEGDRIQGVAYSASGHLLVPVYDGRRQPGIWAIPFSASRLEVTGAPFMILPRGSISLSRRDTLVFVASRDVAPTPGRLVWVDRTGAVVDALERPLLSPSTPSLSPDGTRVAVSAHQDGAVGAARQLVVVDVASESRLQLSDELGTVRFPRWRPDGRAILYGVWNSGVRALRELELESGDPPRTLMDQSLRAIPVGDGRGVLSLYDAVESFDPGTAERRTVLAEHSFHFELSHDERYLAYASAGSLGGSGTAVLLQRYPSGGAVVPVAAMPVRGLRWSADDSELYFWSEDDLVAVPIDLRGPQPVIGAPEVLFTASETGLRMGLDYDVAADGRFLMIQPLDTGDGDGDGEAPREPDASPTDRFLIIQNWAREFEDRPSRPE